MLGRDQLLFASEILKNHLIASSLGFVSSCGEKVRISGRLLDVWRNTVSLNQKEDFTQRPSPSVLRMFPLFIQQRRLFSPRLSSIYGETVRRYWILGLKMWRFERKWDERRWTFYGNVRSQRNKWIWSVFGLKKAGLKWFYKLKEAVHLSKKWWVWSRTKLGPDKD